MWTWTNCVYVVCQLSFGEKNVLDLSAVIQLHKVYESDTNNGQ